MDLLNFLAIVLDAGLVVEDLAALYVNVANKEVLPLVQNVMKWIHVKKRTRNVQALKELRKIKAIGVDKWAEEMRKKSGCRLLLF